MKNAFLRSDMKMERFQREQLIDGIDSLGRKIEFTYQNSKFQYDPRVDKMILSTQCYKYLGLTMWFHAKKSKETLKKSKSPILLHKFGSQVQKYSKIAQKRISP